MMYNLLFVGLFVSSFIRHPFPFVLASEPQQPNDEQGRQTVLIDKLPTRQRKHIEKEILNLLGLEHTPRPDSRTAHADAPAPSYMMTLYRSMSHRTTVSDTGSRTRKSYTRKKTKDPYRMDSSNSVDLEQLNSADTVMSFVNQAHANDLSNDDRTIDFHFDVSPIPPSDILLKAVLRLYTHGKPLIAMLASQQTLKLDILFTMQDFNGKLVYRLEASRTLASDVKGWIDVNVTYAIDEWRRYPIRNRGFILRVSDSEGSFVDPSLFGIVGHHGPDDKQAFLVAFFKSGPVTSAKTKAASSRHKRSPLTQPVLSRRQESSASEHEDSIWPYSSSVGKNRKCQRRTLYVSFKQLGWQDWIIAPEGYSANYCYGDCSFPLHAYMNATNHAIVQTLAHLMDPITVPKPCCAPTKLLPLSVLYFDDNSNVILKKYRNMIVRACGCH